MLIDCEKFILTCSCSYFYNYKRRYHSIICHLKDRHEYSSLIERFRVTVIFFVYIYLQYDRQRYINNVCHDRQRFHDNFCHGLWGSPNFYPFTSTLLLVYHQRKTISIQFYSFLERINRFLEEFFQLKISSVNLD